MKKLLVLACVAALSACASTGGSGPTAPGAPIGNLVRWRCDGGSSFGVGFTTTGARVAAGGQTYALPHVQSGSGARYSNGSVQYWEHAGQATLTGARGGPYNNCHRG